MGTPAFEELAEGVSAARRTTGSAARVAHAEGLVALLWSPAGSASAQDAVRRLEAALDDAPADPDVLSDLGAAHLLLGSSPGRAYHLVQALELIERVLDRDPGHPPARFNRGLALTRLGLLEDAVESWHSVEALEPGTQWAAEARARAEHVGDELRRAGDLRSRAAISVDSDREVLGRVAREDPQTARTAVFDEMLPTWAAARTTGDVARADHALAAAAALASPLVDRSAADALTDVGALVGRAEPSLAQAIGAVQSFTAARAHYRAARDADAEAAFRSAATGFRAAGIDAAAAWADFWRASSLVGLVRYGSAIAVGERVLADDDVHRWPALTGMTRWILGLAEGRQGGYGPAARHYAVAEEEIERAGESAYLANVWGLQAEVQTLLGDTEAAWQRTVRALVLLGARGERERQQMVLIGAADAADRSGLGRAALVFLDVAVRLGREHGVPPNLMADALLRRARVRIELGDTTGAAVDAGEARRSAAGIDDPAVAAWTHADVWRMEAAVAGRHSGAGLARLDSALSAQMRLRNDHHRVALLLERSSARHRAGVAGALEDVDSAMALAERTGGDVFELLDRARFARTTRELVTHGASLLAIDHGDPVTALGLVERGATLMWPGPTSVREQDPSAVSGGLADDLAVIRYLATVDAVLTWVLTRDAIHFIRLPVGALELRRAALDLRESASKSEIADNAVAASRRLARMILPDTLLGLARGGDLVFVPDAALSGVPFDVLPDGDGRPLFENRVVRMATSLRAAAGRRAPSAADDPTGTRVLLVGDPLVPDSVTYPPLPAARAEVERLATIYPDAASLTGRAATRGALLEALPAARIFHFAGHAVSAPESPAGSHLVLSPGTADASADLLYGYELARSGPGAPELVVLTACESLGPEAGGGFRGVAQPFLLRGSRAVVGTLWRVEDRGAAALSVLLHEGLAEGLTPAAALKRAKSRAAASGLVPFRDLAAFQVLTG